MRDKQKKVKKRCTKDNMCGMCRFIAKGGLIAPELNINGRVIKTNTFNYELT